MGNPNSENPNARSGRAVTDQPAPQDGAHTDTSRAEPRAYVARDYRDATVAPPASGELTDYYDEGDPSGGMQQGQDRTRFAAKDVQSPQGPKTHEAIQKIVKSGSPDQGSR